MPPSWTQRRMAGPRLNGKPSYFSQYIYICLILSRFKLHLRPSHLPLIAGLDLPPLPPDKTVDDVFTDFLRFVKEQLQAYITARFAEGAQIWDVLSPTMDVVLTTPNGWELEQQQRMRASAQRAGLIPLDGGKRVRFVTEAEVSTGCVLPFRNGLSIVV
jgi:hypothetical protein